MSLDFSDLTVQEEPVKYDGQEYKLVEADAEAAKVWRNARAASMKFDKDGNFRGVGDVGENELLLITLCLKTLDDKPVGLATIKKWPNRVTKAIFKQAHDMSSLREDSAEFASFTAALSRDDCPVNLDELREWAKTLPDEDDEYKLFKMWASMEETAKN